MKKKWKHKHRIRALSIVGARPQFIKLKPVHQALVGHGWEHIIVHTGQHYDDRLSASFFSELAIPEPHYNLGIGSGSHGRQTGRAMEILDDLLGRVKPDVVIVYGDTNATVAGVLAATKLKIPVAHIEAGMRSFNRDMPEEINRVVTDHLATWHFCANQEAVDNLRAEGIVNNVYNVGDVMIDVLRQMRPDRQAVDKLLQRLKIKPRQYLFATVHRPSNTDNRQRLKDILDGLKQTGWPVVISAHPRLVASIKRHRLQSVLKNSKVRLIRPLGYVDNIAIQQAALAVITDSGGMQKEAHYLRVPCLTLRHETEWNETLQYGWNQLILDPKSELPTKAKKMRRPRKHRNFFGHGHAAEDAVKILKKSIKPERGVRPHVTVSSQ